MLDVAVSKGTVRARQSAYWFFNDKYGDQGAEYVPIDPRNTADHWPSIPARLTCDVAYSRRVLGGLSSRSEELGCTRR
jgi:hypothetical protein